MIFHVREIRSNMPSLMRRAGYAFQYERDGEMSFVRPFGRSGYPRFHVYVKEEKSRWTLSLHLDQKKETYGKTTRHHGEYEDEGAVKEEKERIIAAFGSDSQIA